MVWAAYKKVKANKGSAGVDQISMEKFDANRSKQLYKLWNRMASGSYFPPPVKEVEIAKKDGKTRKLGIPTIADRIGQMVIKDYLEPRLEKIFSSNSYGYRPNRNAHQALDSVRNNCRKTDWVIDLDIKGFFDNIDHGKLMLAVEKHVNENWCLIYIKRWLNAPVQKKSGELIRKQGKGTPQGGVISPLLANLFLHYAMDKWLELKHKTVNFERYADDAILHCKSKAHAEWLLEKIRDEWLIVGWNYILKRLNWCIAEIIDVKASTLSLSSIFWGIHSNHAQQKSHKTRKLFLGYDCAISINSKKRIADKMEELNIVGLTFKSIVGVAQFLNPFIRDG